MAIVSNHSDLAEAARGYGLPFFHIPVAGANKAEGEVRQLALLAELRTDLVILARYMQVLSADFLEKCKAPVINIHHSFLPAFAGGRPSPSGSCPGREADRCHGALCDARSR